jgi:O-antigen/teichoic acid export membrane protein
VAVAQAITWTATFLFTLAQARYLSPARFAELSLALSYGAIVTVVVDFGLSTKLARDVAQRPGAAGHALMTTSVARVVLWCLAMPLVWASTAILGYHAELQATILILGGAMLFGGVAASLGAFFQGREEFLIPSLGSIMQRGSAALLGIGALALGHGIVVVATVYVVASVLQVIVMLPGMRRHAVSFSVVDRASLMDAFRGAAILGCFWILGALYINVDMLILQRLVPLENVAWYAAASRLYNAALIVPMLFTGMVLYPALSRLSVGSRDALRAAIDKAFTFLLATGVFVALATFVYADRGVALLYPAQDYHEAATALRLLAPGLVATYVGGVFLYTLLGLRFDGRLLLMAAILAILNPLANLFAVPVFQQNAAALITSGTEAVVLVWVLVATPRDLRAAARPLVVGKVLLAATVGGTCLWLLRDQSFLLGIPLAGVVYALTLVALGTVPANDLDAAGSLLRRTVSRAERPDRGAVIPARTADR